MSNYKSHQVLIKSFLEEFRDSDDVFVYRDMLQDIANRKLKQLTVNLDDVFNCNIPEVPNLVQVIVQNCSRYVELFAAAADEAMPERDENVEVGDEDAIEVLMSQRRQRMAETQAESAASGDMTPAQRLHNTVPPELKRRFDVRFVPLSKDRPLHLRAIRAPQIGNLVSVEGIVTRISEVKPMLRVATYTCDACGSEVYQEISGKQYMPLVACPSSKCVSNSVVGRLHPQTRGSKFVKHQELRLQELASQVPVGHVPRSMSVHLSGELTRSCNAGDLITVSGVFLPEVRTGFSAIRAGLTANTFLEAMSVEKHVKSYADDTIDAETVAEFSRIQGEGSIYMRLARAIAPEIFGSDDVKKALLLQLVGAPTRSMNDGVKIRGDINVLLVGDPGVAKSQLLKHISRISPRGVYTTGKGSSGVGLTAAVMRDQTTNEVVLEGGALVLADMGICCIDEFDKMTDEDRTSIHEVMEQQTVSIAKAGITTTLNARASVLAAANPFYGRYNMRKKISENVALPTSLISRFDLLFLLIDRPDETRDLQLARHVTHVHRYSEPPKPAIDDAAPIPAGLLKKYVAHARTFAPHIPASLSEHITEQYVAMRAAEANARSEDRSVTARSLLSILRLSQALARLRFAEEVEQADVDEAIRLLVVSKESVTSAPGQDEAESPNAAIFRIIVAACKRSEEKSVAYDDIRQKILHKGFTDSQLEDCLESYSDINVLVVSDDNETITLIE